VVALLGAAFEPAVVVALFAKAKYTGKNIAEKTHAKIKKTHRAISAGCIAGAIFSQALVSFRR
jgi:hypothetical protein